MKQSTAVPNVGMPPPSAEEEPELMAAGEIALAAKKENRLETFDHDDVKDLPLDPEDHPG